jgi:multidrug efflux pump subunit AcrA (membrane-fusion protein)
MSWKTAVKTAGALGAVALAGWGGVSIYLSLATKREEVTPAAPVRRGGVTFSISAQGALQGGNSKMLAAPMTGANQLVLTQLIRTGDLVGEGDVVAQFDTTEESYRLREAEADLAEAEQQVMQAQNDSLAREEELKLELLKARSEVVQAELEVRRNPLLAGIAARQNDLALEAARERLEKIERDLPARMAAAKASIAIQEAARSKAQIQAETARKNIELMTLKAPAKGYINVERNTDGNMFYQGMQFPLFQIGDQVRAGVAVAQLPDLGTYEAMARISEQDRGHVDTGLETEVRVVALENRLFTGRVADLGGTTGPMWDRRFECKIKLDQPTRDLRPGMSVRMVIKSATMKGVLWIPAQALFESDGRTFVYVQSGKSFTARDVKLVRRGESQAVLEGVKEGELVALASPDQGHAQQKGPAASASKAVAK